MFFFEDFSGQRTLTEAKVVPHGKVVDNTLLRHIFRAAWFPARAWQVIVVPIVLTLWSGQLPVQSRVILAQIFRYQTERVKTELEMRVYEPIVRRKCSVFFRFNDNIRCSQIDNCIVDV